MRILFTTVQLSGHFHPLVPLARAAVAAGHDVAFACAASFVPVIEKVGFRAFPAGFDNRGRTFGELFPGMESTGKTVRYWALPNIFIAVHAVAMVPDLLSLSRQWQPDLIVRESHEYGGCVAAEVLGIPHASMRTAAISSQYGMRNLVEAPLARLRELNGLSPDPDVQMPFRYLHFAAEPPGFRLPNEAVVPTAHPLRPVNFEGGDTTLPSWVGEVSELPTIYATLGTVFSREALGRATFPLLLEALRDEPINLALTVGRDNDPAQWGPQPPNVHIEQFIPQSQLLPYCDLVVHHGGFSTVTGALNAGLPMVVIPLSADQPYNAACCAALGVGAVITPDACTADTIRATVREVLTNPQYRQRSERVRDEIAALPGMDTAVTLLEQLAKDKEPLYTSGAA